MISFNSYSAYSQCPNIGFENCDFTGWLGTYSKSDAPPSGGDPADTCQDGTGPGTFLPCISNVGIGSFGVAPNPFRHIGLAIGTTNQASNATPENSHFIMNSGSDAVVGSALSVVAPNGGSCSARLGNSQQSGGGETLMYKFVVDASTSSFTYSYAVILDGGTHDEYEQPFFKIRMYAYNTPTDSVLIDCATYDVTGITAPNIGGFVDAGGYQWKDWSSVTVPLSDYMGQTVAIQFITKDCCPQCTATNDTASAGSHYAFCYVDASCEQLEIIPSAPSVCAGQNITLTAPSAGTYSWTGPSIVSGVNEQVATVDQPGDYTVVMTTLSNTPCTYSLSATMPGNLAGGANVSVNSESTCAGGSATLTASGGVTYSWQPGGETSESITVSPASTTTYTVTGSSATCGSGTAEGTITISPIPTSPFTTIDVCVDVSSTITYTGNASPTDIYTWNFGTGIVNSGSGQGPYDVSWSTDGTKNITLTVTVGSCVSPLTTTPVVVSPIYDPGFSYTPSTICKTGGSDPTPTISGDAGGIFSATENDPPVPSSITIDANTGVIDLASTPLGEYTITYDHAGTCPSSSTYDIAVVDVPVADFTFDEYCQNEPNPAPTPVNGGTAGVFTATAGLIFVSPEVTPGEVDLSASTPGTHTVTNTLGGGGGCPQVVATHTIIINPIPVTMTDNQTICNGESATLTANGAVAYAWSDGSAVSTLTASPTATTSYTVTGTSAGCTSASVGYITVNPIPITTVSDGNVCDGSPATVSAAGADAYLWSDGTAGADLIVTPSTATSYTVTGTLLGCTSEAVSTVQVTPMPVVTVNDANICQGNTATLTPAGATSYLWSDTTFTSPKSVTPTTTTVYSVFGSTADCNSLPTITPDEQNAYFTCWSQGCIGSDSSIVTITLLPDVIVNSPAICSGESATLTASGGATYDWQTGETGNSIIVSPLTTTTYNVADNTPGCMGSAVSTVTVYPLPTVTVNSETICEGESTTLTTAGASTYVWSDASTTNPMTVSPTTTTSYTVVGTDANGCVGTAISTVTVNPLPVITVDSAMVCQGVPATLTASGASTYAWSSGSAGAALTDTPSATNVYTVTGTDANGCSSTGSGTITIIPTPTAEFDASPQPAIVSFPTITFNDQSSTDVIYWNWDFGDGDTLAPSTPNPIHTYPKVETTYDVTLIVRNSLCQNSIMHQIVIGPEYSFFIPNAFTPNGDGENDTFFGKGKGILEYELMIFDRWGNFIFYAEDINDGWDGKANDGTEAAQQDVYVWKVNLKDIFNKTHRFIGTVTLVRGD